MSLTFFRSIPGKLIVLYLGLTAAALGTITVLFQRTTESIILTSVQTHLEAIARSKAVVIAGWLDERQHDAEVLAKNATIVHDVTQLLENVDNAEALRGDLKVLLHLVHEQHQVYHELSLVDRDANVLVSSRAEPSASQPPDAELLDAIRQGRSHVSAASVRGGDGALALDIGVPIQDRSGTVIGAVLAQVDLSAVNEMTDAMTLMESGEAYLVDERGVFVTHRDRRRVLQDDISAVPGVAEVISGRNGFGVYDDYRGVPVVGAYQWLPKWRWGLMAEVDRDEALAALHRARSELLLVAALVLAAVILGTLLVVRSIVRPLRELTRAVQAVASGKLDHQVEPEGHDEVATLTKSFNRMTAHLHDTQSATEERIAQATSKVAERNEQLASANAHFADINDELREANEELAKQRALIAQSARLAVLGEMAAGIAHEINNPLTTIKNLVHSLRADTPKDDLREKDMGIVAEELDSIQKLVADFQQYARPAEANVSAVDLAQLIDRVADLIEPQLRQKQLEIAPQSSEDLPLILADPDQLGQVVLNLLLNASHAAPKGSEIRVSTHVVYSDDGTLPQRVELHITDDGPGIAPEHRDKVFSPFFTTKAQGSGLGLAISQRIVQQQGGELRFTSTPGAGATFIVSFPLDKESSDERHPDR